MHGFLDEHGQRWQNNPRRQERRLKSRVDEGTGNAEKQFKLELIVPTMSEVCNYCTLLYRENESFDMLSLHCLN